MLIFHDFYCEYCTRTGIHHSVLTVLMGLHTRERFKNNKMLICDRNTEIPFFFPDTIKKLGSGGLLETHFFLGLRQCMQLHISFHVRYIFFLLACSLLTFHLLINFLAAILQHTADFIQNLKREKDRLESENSHLQRMLEVYNDSPPRKRWKRDTGIMSGWKLYMYLLQF